jgi:hypothetical protein
MSWLTTTAQVFQIATPLIGLGAIFVAWKALRTNREIAIQKSTFDFILKLQTDQRMLSANDNCNDSIKKLRLKTEHIVDFSTDVAKPELDKIYDLFNIYEFMAISVGRGILSDEILKENYRTTVIRKFDVCKVVIDDVRDRGKVPRAYVAVEELVNRWRSS